MKRVRPGRCSRGLGQARLHDLVGHLDGDRRMVCGTYFLLLLLLVPVLHLSYKHRPISGPEKVLGVNKVCSSRGLINGHRNDIQIFLFSCLGTLPEMPSSHPAALKYRI